MERNRSDGNEKTMRFPSGAAVMRGDVTEALTGMFFEEWARTGYAGLSLETVARKAGVGKAALYRRWPEKSAMASDLLSRVGLTMTDVAEQGSLEADLEAVLFAIRRVLRHPNDATDHHRPSWRDRKDAVTGEGDTAIPTRTAGKDRWVDRSGDRTWRIVSVCRP